MVEGRAFDLSTRSRQASSGRGKWHLPAVCITSCLVRLPPLGGEGWGWGIFGARRFCRTFPLPLPTREGNCVRDCVDDCVDVFVQLLVAEANDAEAACGEPVGALLVVRDRFLI